MPVPLSGKCVMNIVAMFANMIVREGASTLGERFSLRDIDRAVGAYVAVTGFAGVDPPSDGQHFIVGHLLGYESALKRAAIAISDPRARGVERAVLDALADGLDIEAAIRKAQPPAEETERGVASNVIAFPKRSE